MYGFWFDYVKRNNGENANFCHMDTYRLIVYVKAADIYNDIAEDVYTTKNFEIDRPLPKGKDKKVIGLTKEELGGQIIK